MIQVVLNILTFYFFIYLYNFRKQLYTFVKRV